MQRIALPPLLLLRSALRSFLLQASWNFERLQNLGVVYILGPALRQLYAEEQLQQAYARHLSYFNTHPFMASAVFGALLRLEEERRNGVRDYIGVEEFRGMVAAPYAAIGDALFWGALRPLAAGLALFFAVKESLWAPLVLLLTFNLPHLWFRLVGFWQGYRLGLKIVELVQRRRLPDLAIRIKETTVVLFGGLAAYLVTVTLQSQGQAPLWGLGGIPLVLLCGWLARKGVSVLIMVLAGTALVVVLCRLTG